MRPKDADEMANSVDPDQTATGATVCQDLSVRKLTVIIVNKFESLPTNMTVQLSIENYTL